MSDGPEYVEVEGPFLDQLALMDWATMAGDIEMPSVTGRGTFREVRFVDDLRSALRRIKSP